MSCPSCFKIPFVNCCHVRLSPFLLIYQLGADCHRRWIMLQVDGMAGNPTTSLFLMRRLMGYQLSGETWISSGQNWPESCQGGTYTRIGSTFEDKRGWWTRMDSGSPQKKSKKVQQLKSEKKCWKSTQKEFKQKIPQKCAKKCSKVDSKMR